MTLLMSFLIVGVGGALGAMSRLAMNLLLARAIVFVPMGTLASNLIGCFVMGIVIQALANPAWFTHGDVMAHPYRLLFAVGFCGSFTTLSALVFELSTLVERGELLSAFAYLGITLIGGFASFYGGAALLRSVVQS